MNDNNLNNSAYIAIREYDILRTKLFSEWYGNELDTPYNSLESQDRFAHKMIGDNGYFLDIGCGEPIVHNNTVALEKLGWKGLLIDKHDLGCQRYRSSKYLKVDVTSKSFKDILVKETPRQIIDYISLDVDDFSVIALEQILSLNIIFKVMTFEHDFYIVKEERRAPSRRLLQNAGYFLLFEDVIGLKTEEQPWEDWWIHPDFFHSSILQKKSNNLWHYECINKL